MSAKIKKIVLEIPEAEKIEINGDIFEIRRSDADILSKYLDLQKKYEDLMLLREAGSDIEVGVEAVKNAVNETVALIDDILGGGAFMKISGGRPVNIITACGWLTAICREINQINSDYTDAYIKDKYCES